MNRWGAARGGRTRRCLNLAQPENTHRWGAGGLHPTRPGIAAGRNHASVGCRCDDVETPAGDDRTSLQMTELICR